MTRLFWVSFGLLIYVYIGYPLLAWLLARLVGREPRRRDIMPSVSLLIPAWNEERHIGEKLRNSLALNYPKDQLEIVVASDGSTDRTDAIVHSCGEPWVRLLRMPEHAGKVALLNHAVPQLHGELVVFSDASGTLEPAALRRLVSAFADPKVGCVSGRYRLGGATDLRAQGEGLYWRYETWLKQQESRLHSILGAHGAFYAIRRRLFQPLEPALINDDYLIPMRIVAAGFRAVYEPGAVAWEREAASVEGEFARRRRIAVGNCQQVRELLALLNPLRGWIALEFFSHKVLRTVAPLAMVTLLFSSLWLPAPWAAWALTLQGAFYLAAYAGYLCQRYGRRARWLSPAFYFCLGNLAMLAGLLLACRRQGRPAWGLQGLAGLPPRSSRPVS